MIKPAIIAVGYNRPSGIERLLDSIGKAKYETTDIPLIISIDESNLSNEVEQVARNFQWNYGTKEIRRFSKRQGLRNHIVQCGDYSEKYGAVIILEDDLIVAEDFYSYVCKAHEAYSDNKKICGISLYSYSSNVFTHLSFTPIPSIYDVYLGDMVVTWGQSWTSQQWSAFKKWYTENLDKLPIINENIPKDISEWVRSWGKYFAYYMAENQLSYIFPYVARSTCFSDFGEHNKASIPLTFVQVPLMQGYPEKYQFGKYEQLYHYDSFYDIVLDESCFVSGIPGNEICMDLNNMKTCAGNKNYVITSSKLPYLKIKSFGLTLKPIPLNVLSGIPGDQVHLYKLKKGNTLIRLWKGKRQSYQISYKRLKYEYNDPSWRAFLFYVPIDFFTRLKDQLIKIINK